MKTLQKIAAGFRKCHPLFETNFKHLTTSLYKNISKTHIPNSYEPPAAPVSCFMGASRALAHEAKSSSSMAFESKSTFFQLSQEVFPFIGDATCKMKHEPTKTTSQNPCFFQSFSRGLGTILLKNIQKNCSQDQVPAGPEPLGLPSHLMLQGLFRRSSHIDHLETNSIKLYRFLLELHKLPSAYSRHKFSHRHQGFNFWGFDAILLGNVRPTDPQIIPGHTAYTAYLYMKVQPPSP